MMITHKINLDLINRGIVPRIHAVQGDALTRQVQISLTCDGTPWQVPDLTSVLIRYRRRDRVAGEYDTLSDGTPAGSVDGSAVTILLPREVLCISGDVMVVVTLISGGRELSTFEFLVAVQSNLSQGVLSDSEMTSVTGMLPAPACAQAGQILVIDEVDEYGLIRGMKASDALPGTVITQIVPAQQQPDPGMTRYTVTMDDGSVHFFDVPHGKSAYTYAREAGFTGTEEEFSRKLAGDCTEIYVGEEAPANPEIVLWVDTSG